MTILSTHARFKLPREAFFTVGIHQQRGNKYISSRCFLTLHAHQNRSVFRFCCSLTAKPLQNIPVLCWGQLEAQQSVGALPGEDSALKDQLS